MSKLVDLMRDYREKFPKATFDEAMWLVIGFEGAMTKTREERARETFPNREGFKLAEPDAVTVARIDELRAAKRQAREQDWSTVHKAPVEEWIDHRLADLQPAGEETK